ncbi:Uncharacterized protein BM_BM285, partial [Brugia malayi]
MEIRTTREGDDNSYNAEIELHLQLLLPYNSLPAQV